MPRNGFRTALRSRSTAMRVACMSNNLALAYLAERYRLVVFGPLAVVLALAGALAMAPGTVAPPSVSLIASFLIAFLLVLAFRIWDDLEDLGRDVIEHPDRITVRATRRWPFGVLL